MGKTTKIWLVTAAFLVLAGCVLWAGVMAVYQWDFTELSTDQYETKIYEISEDFYGISMDTDTADITFVLSEDAKCRVVCSEQKNVTHSVEVKEGTLVIKTVDSRKWYEHIGIHWGSPKITVHLPKEEYASLFVRENTGDIDIPSSFQFESVDLSLSTGHVRISASASDAMKIKTNTGSIRVENAYAGALDLSVSTGNITVSNVICHGDASIHVSTGKSNLTDLQCKNLTSDGDTGDISLSNVIAAEKFSIRRDTGDVKFHHCDAADIFVITDTGDVTGTFLSAKRFFVETDTGHVHVPKSNTGGRCEVKTDTGDIRLDIA